MNTTTGNDPDDICRMCGRTREWHQTNFVRHPFTPAGTVAELRDVTQDRKAIQDAPDARITHTSVPFDPALRLCLIENGVITIQQLGEAEEKLRVVTKMVNTELNDGG